MPQVTEKLFRAATMPIMTQAMKPPPVRPRTEPLPPTEIPPPEGELPPDESELPPDGQGETPQPKALRQNPPSEAEGRFQPGPPAPEVKARPQRPPPPPPRSGRRRPHK